ncbi:MAG: universal stress protein [Thermoguttaceae bacterium]
MTSFYESPIVVPIDLSEFSMKACNAALQIAKDRSQIKILHVLPILEPAEPGLAWPTFDDNSRVDNAKIFVKEFLATHSCDDLEITIRVGDPGSEIAFFAEEIEAGLVVIPSHGRSAIKRLLLGSTADRVVHLCNCPVLVVKGQK